MLQFSERERGFLPKILISREWWESLLVHGRHGNTSTKDQNINNGVFKMESVLFFH